jgi:anti-anti-sigma factor
MNSRPATSPHSGPKQSTFVSIDFKSGVLTIVPAGPTLGERETMVVAAEVRPWLTKHSNKLRAVVIDLSHVEIMTSFGLGWCIEVRNAARLINAKTVLFGLHRELLELIRMMKVERLYTIAHNAGDLASATAA